MEDIKKAVLSVEKILMDYLLKSKKTSMGEYKQGFKKLLNGVCKQLDKGSYNYIKEQVKGNKDASKLTKKLIRNKTQISTSKEITQQAYLELHKGLKDASKTFYNSVQKDIKELAKGGMPTVMAVQNLLKTKYAESGVLSVTYSNGRKQTVASYADMVARSARGESANISAFSRALDNGTDLVKCTTMSVTCPTCEMYQGRVYSISGKDKRFPNLYETALHNGYSLIHPNCRHEFIPYYEEFHKATGDFEKDLKFSNRAFKENKPQKAYQEWQAKNRQIRAEYIEYEEMKKVLGEKMPYTTIAGYRRARRADNENYYIAKKNVKTFKTKAELDIGLTSISKNDKIQIVNTKLLVQAESYHIAERMVDRGISTDTIIDAFRTQPLKIDDVKTDGQGRQSQKILFENITLYINPETGRLITVHATHKKTAKKLKGDE